MSEETRYFRRRDFLSAIASGIAVSLGGCFDEESTENPDEETNNGEEFGPVPDPSDPVYGDWIPSSFADEGVSIRHIDLRATTTRRYHPFLNDILAQTDYVGVETKDIEHAFSMNQNFRETVILTSPAVDKQQVVSEVEQMNYEERTPYKTFAVYSRSDDRNFSIAVSDIAIITRDSREVNQPTDRLKKIIDTNDGDNPSIYESETAFRTVADTVGSSSIGGVLNYNTDNLTSDLSPDCHGVSYLPRDNDVYYLSSDFYLHKEGASLQEASQRREAERRIPEIFSRVRSSIDYHGDSFSVNTEAQAAQSEFASGIGDMPRIPFITFSVKQQENSITIKHERGDSVETADISIHVDTPDSGQDLSDRWTEQLQQSFNVFGQSDEITYDIPDTGYFELKFIYQDMNSILRYENRGV